MEDRIKKRLINTLRNNHLTIDELCEEFKTENEEMQRVIGGLQSEGIPVDIKQTKNGADMKYHIRVLPEIGNVFHLSDCDGRKTYNDKLAITMDIHMASKFHLPKSFDEALMRTEDAGIKDVLVAGDLLDGNGIYRGHDENLLAGGVEDQTDMAAKALSKHPGLHFWAISGNHDYCISTDTEVLTREGWKVYGELTIEDFVLTLREDNGAEWQKVENIHFFENSQMFQVDGRGLSIRCTANHRIPYFTYNTRTNEVNRESLKFRTLESVNDADVRVPVSVILQNKKVDVCDDLLRLMAWVLTDGSIRKTKNSSSYMICQSKPEMIERIKSLLEHLEVQYTSSTRDRSDRTVIIDGKEVKSQRVSTTFRLSTKFTNDSLKELLPDKAIPSWMLNMSKEQFSVFFQELILGDGSKYADKECYKFYGTEAFLEEVQTLCHVFGYRATITQSNRGDFRLNICEQTEVLLRKKNITQLSEPEDSWCLTVKNSNFLMRYNGKICFTGNSFTKQNGAKPLAILESKLDNFTNLGDFRADIIRHGIRFRLLHGGSGRAYARSYPSQTYLREYFAGLEREQIKNIPHILALGHYHTIYQGFDHGMHVLQTGSFQDGDNEYCIRKGLNGLAGLLHINIKHKGDKIIDFNSNYVIPTCAASEKGAMHARNTRNY